MSFFTSAVGVLQTLVIALGAGLAIWGVVNLMACSYAHAHFSVVHHRDNHSLNASMAEYRQMISPETPFSSFTNEDILRSAERHSEGLQEWIGWYEKMYRM